MVIDRQRKLPSTLHLFDNTSDTFVFCASEELTVNRTRYVQLDFEKDIIPQMLARIASEGIQSIIVEGGRKLLTGFIESGLWDEARIFTGAKEFGSGILAPEIQAVKSSEWHIREDLLTIYRNQITP
jgi:diaminohydroxyphosphoribosylaminopyrimidine deaminase/5-amino-6-(5-phosphoribosylamino)uracil reductase